MDVMQGQIHEWAAASSKILHDCRDAGGRATQEAKAEESGRITEVNGHSINVDFWEKSFDPAYTPFQHHLCGLIDSPS